MHLQLVSVVAQRLGIRVDDLLPGEKIQLITAAVGAWQTFQQRDQHRDTAACALRSFPMHLRYPFRQLQLEARLLPATLG